MKYCFGWMDSPGVQLVGRKQKIVIKVPTMNNPKCRSKAMKAVVSLPGVISATLEGNDMDQLAVVGDGVDSVTLTTLLRKKMGITELISLTVVDEKKEEEKKEEEKKPSIETVAWPTSSAYQYSVPQPMHYVYQDPYRDNCCIM
ncbi:heavy metal-associated isoprenylated plant protein 47-like isoform X1 [Magnolia sinica]|uniref:heavy metal-associated isoprenylated plant protein 47-like isoform X1 n=1 Tax=Magnolia sinica TaxID=86752 RepID=UPI00265A3B11|nr:heavy metal-associated isoprenylated plant protein 47-like isoform X1 [Magnolia sinica]